MDSHSNNHVHDTPPFSTPSSNQPTQSWTLDGYPIVDGKYHNLLTNRIEVHTGRLRGGPPSVSVYWHNRGASGKQDQFYAVGSLSRHTVSEYLVRIGEMLKKEKCVVSSLNATEFAVSVVVKTELGNVEFLALLRDHGLQPSEA